MPALILHRRSSPLEESKLPPKVEYSEPVRRITLAASSHKNELYKVRFFYPFKTEEVGIFLIYIYQLFHKCSAPSSNAFIEKQLILNLGNCGPLNSSGMRDKRIEIEFVVVHLLLNPRIGVSEDDIAKPFV